MLYPARLGPLAALLTLSLAACGGGGGETTPVNPQPAADHVVSVSSAAGSIDNRLACFTGSSKAECNLRLYQIMVESFIDGDATANYNTGYGSSHHHGDLQGIINSLDYIKSTGVNAIWLTPIFESSAIAGQSEWVDRLDATGYYSSNPFKIDPKFGTAAQFKALVDSAHAKGLYVFLDGVFGHYKENLATSPNGIKPTNGLCTNESGGSYTASSDIKSACADFSAADTRDYFREVASYWVSNYKIDGWRLDQAYQVPVGEWANLRQTVQTAAATVSYTNSQGASVNPLGYMVAEVWSGESTIQSRAYGSTASPALASAFDFPIRYRLVQTLASEEWGMSNGKRNLAASNLVGGYAGYSAYPDHAMPNLMLTNHDLVRFGDLIQRAGLANPDQDAYWNRHKAAFAFMAAHSGPITLYYGDEIGQEVANYAAKVETNCSTLGLCDDHVSRDSGKVSGLDARQTDLKAYVASLMQLRDTNPALAYGSRTHLFADSNVYLDAKVAGSNRVLFVLNAKTTAAVITLKSSVIGSAAGLTDLLSNASISASGDAYQITVPALSGRFLKY